MFRCFCLYLCVGKVEGVFWLCVRTERRSHPCFDHFPGWLLERLAPPSFPMGSFDRSLGTRLRQNSHDLFSVPILFWTSRLCFLCPFCLLVVIIALWLDLTQMLLSLETLWASTPPVCRCAFDGLWNLSILLLAAHSMLRSIFANS